MSISLGYNLSLILGIELTQRRLTYIERNSNIKYDLCVCVIVFSFSGLAYRTDMENIFLLFFMSL